MGGRGWLGIPIPLAIFFAGAAACARITLRKIGFSPLGLQPSSLPLPIVVNKLNSLMPSALMHKCHRRGYVLLLECLLLAVQVRRRQARTQGIQKYESSWKLEVTAVDHFLNKIVTITSAVSSTVSG